MPLLKFCDDGVVSDGRRFTPFCANAISLNTRVAGTIANSSDTDFFQFKTPPKYRDWIDVEVENRSTALQPTVTVYNSEKGSIGSAEAPNAGANVKYSFVCQPASVYYAQISPYKYNPAAGAYNLIVTARRTYDAFEPNDDFQTASSIGLGKTIQAGIMDAGDTDYYQFKTAKCSTGNLLVTVKNNSQDLQPVVSVFNAEKGEVGSAQAPNSGADVQYSFACLPNSYYYVQVSPYKYNPASGEYSLKVTEQ